MRSPLNPGSLIRRAAEKGRSLIRRADQIGELIWERKKYHFPSQPSTAEMTARLLRMGVPGFSEYAYGQMVGSYGARTFVALDKQRIVDTLRSRYPGEVESILAIAERILHGRFEVLGSDLADLRRGARGRGSAITWNLDPISGKQFANVFNHWRWNPGMLTSGADIKGPWEIGRCQHFVVLGQAYWLTNDRRFSRCFAETIQDFLKHNPPGFGVQWACTMDVALRVVSWIAGLSFFQNAPELGIRWWRMFLKGLAEHGTFIAANLEFGTMNGEIITSNHYLSNLLGLYWLALAFPHLDAGCVWRGIAENALEQEIQKQIHPDGGDFESSVPYQRLVIEIFLSAFALSVHHGVPLSAAYRARLLKGLEFVAGLRQENGRVPQIGDADNGRAHVFTRYGVWRQESMDHLLVAGAHILKCPELAASVPEAEQLEVLFWGPAPEVQTSSPTPKRLEVFPNTGIAIMRAKDTYVAMSNSIVGTRGFGNHKHNDQLAIEWIIGKQPLAVDGGSYIYTRDPESRNLFRSTATHNTVMVDGLEQNTFDKSRLFKMDQQGVATFMDSRSQDFAVGVAGRHTAYCRLDAPLVHVRRVLLRTDGGMLLDDLFEGPPEHRLRWYFLLYPGVSVRIQDGIVELSGPEGGGVINAASGLQFRSEPGWYSDGYGSRIRTSALVGEMDHCPPRMSLLFLPAGCPGTDLADAIALADRFWA